ncbi:MAG: hypothetical protein ACOCVR_03220 [Myxococcota bacterium]
MSRPNTYRISLARRLVRCAVLFCLMLSTGTAIATVVGAWSVEELTAESDLVLRARVSGLESRLYDEGRRVATLVEMRVLETYKGEMMDAVEIVVPGGSHGEIVQVVQGAPGFTEEEEVVLFLEHAGPVRQSGMLRRFRLVSLGLGAFVLEEGMARRKTPRLRVAHESLGNPRLLEPRQVEMPLHLLEERVRVALGDGLP